MLFADPLRPMLQFSPLAFGSSVVGTDAAGDFAARAVAPLGFFCAWIVIGLAGAIISTRYGHDLKLMVPTGIGLGPLVWIKVADARRRRSLVEPLVVRPGFDHGGTLDVLVIVQGAPESVLSLAPTLAAIESEVGVIALARVVAVDWIEHEPINEVVRANAGTLAEAAALLPIGGPALHVLGGPVDAACARFRRTRQRSLVLMAIDEPPSESRRLNGR